MEWDTQFLDRLKKMEGWNPRAYGDYKQTSIGYGTRAKPGETSITPEEGERRLLSELDEAKSYVTKAYPNLEPHRVKALTDLTYNAGPGWINSGLGRLVKDGRHDEAAERILQYNKAGGKVLPGLVKRRKWTSATYRGDGNVRPEDEEDQTSVPNLAGESLGYVNNNVQRGPGGFIQGLKVSGREGELDLIRQYAQARQDALGDAPPERTWQEFAGQGLIGIGSAVSAAHGQNNFASQGLNQLAGMASQHKKALSAHERVRQETSGDVDKYGLETGIAALGDTRLKRAAARKRAHAHMIANGNTPQAISEAVQILESEGDTEAAKRLKASLGDAGAAPVSSAPELSADEASSQAAGVTGAGTTQTPSQAPVGEVPGAAPAQAPTQAQTVPDFVTSREKEIRQLNAALGVDPDNKSLAEKRDALQGQVNDYYKASVKQSLTDESARNKEARKFAKDAPEVATKYESNQIIIDNGLALADRLLQDTPDGSVTLAPGAAANVGRNMLGIPKTYFPNVWDSSAAGWADIQALRNFTKAEGLVQLKKEAGGIGSVTEKEWDTMAGRISALNDDVLNANPDKVASVIADFKDLLTRQQRGAARLMQHKYGDGPWTEKLQGGQRTSVTDQAPTIDDGAIRDPAEKKKLLKSEWDSLEIDGIMTMPNGQRYIKTGPGPRDYRLYEEDFETGDFGTMSPSQIAP